jgi:hypothetical protein
VQCSIYIYISHTHTHTHIHTQTPHTHTHTHIHTQTPHTHTTMVYSDSRSILFINPTTERIPHPLQHRVTALSGLTRFRASVTHFFLPFGLEITIAHAAGGGSGAKWGAYIKKGLASNDIIILYLFIYIFLLSLFVYIYVV